MQYHTDLACDYSKTAAGHSALIGVMLDGRGLYGQYETTGTAPTNLDWCSGHTGAVPAYSSGNISFAAATSVYHCEYPQRGGEGRADYEGKRP